LEDELVSVIYPGRTNGDNGPDFRDAVIVNKSHLTKGDVEVHVKSSDLSTLDRGEVINISGYLYDEVINILLTIC